MATQTLLDEYIEVYLTSFKYVSELVSVPTVKFHLSFEQFLIMRDLHAGHRLAISDVAKHRGVTRAAISRQIKTMLDHHYIVQTRDEGDRRRLYLSLTPEGTEITGQINEAIHKRFYGWVDIIGEHDVKELLRIMRRVSVEVIQTDQREPKAK
ncbi:MarR family winged helix-turn-helix transcriptional regulator [Lacticaseibacillus suibinensis]|uniref:MarR family winged helix-turn-helix transcriptional regulator n=1 Tax=Lacticaseibacillus suibinensis TaxID=2486011 RepID=UPI000F7778D5|nr:MarR family transcriptional regulator [Lacticaseibacillus suibinensis]